MLTAAELVWLLAAVAKGDRAAFERLYAATRAKLYGSWCVSCAGLILRMRSCRTPISRSGTTQASSIPRSQARSRGWLRSPATAPSTWCARRSMFRSRRYRRYWNWLLTRRILLAMRERSEDLGRLLECLGRLDPEQRQLLLLAYCNGWSREQLAAQIRCSGQHDQDLAAAQHPRRPGVPRAS